MDRMDEYRALCAQLEETPPALEYTLTRAKARRRRRKFGRFLGIPAASLAGVFTAFVLLVNFSIPVALACSHVPALLPLLQAVAFSPSLKAAIEHNYAQYIGQSQTVDGITLNLSYLILDDAQLTLLVEVNGPYDTYHTYAEFQTLDGEKLPLSTLSGDFPGGSLEEGVSAYPSSDDFLFPDTIRIVCKVEGYDRAGAPADSGNWDTLPEFVFTVPLDTSVLNDHRTEGETDWVEVDGQRLRFTVESWPTQSRLIVEEHPDNTAKLQTLDFYLEDETGRQYQRHGNGLSAMGTAFLFDTTYFDRPQSLTVHLTDSTWLDPAREYVPIDLETGEVLGTLPDGVSLYLHRQNDTTVNVALTAPKPKEWSEYNMTFYSVSSYRYRTPDGVVHDVTSGWSHYHAETLWPNTEDETAIPGTHFVEKFSLTDCTWDTVELGLYYTWRSEYDLSLSFPLG